MKKRALFGFPGVPVLFAILVSSCYTPGFDPVLTGVRLDRTELVLTSRPPGEHTFTATLQPSGLDWSGTEVEWEISLGPEFVAFVGPLPEKIHEGDGSTSQMRVAAVGNGLAILTVRVWPNGRESGTSFIASCTIMVED